MPQINGKAYTFVYVDTTKTDFIRFSNQVAPFIKYRLKSDNQTQYKANTQTEINVDMAVSELFTADELTKLDETSLAFCLLSGYLEENKNSKYNFAVPYFSDTSDNGQGKNSYMENYHEINRDNENQKYLIDNQGTLSRSTAQEVKSGYLTKNKYLKNWGYAPYCILEDWNGQKTYITIITRVDDNTMKIQTNNKSQTFTIDTEQTRIVIAQRYLYVDNYKIPRVKDHIYLPSWIANDATGWKEKDFADLKIDDIINQCRNSLSTSEYGYIIGSESGRSIGLVEPTTNLTYTADIKEQIKFFEVHWKEFYNKQTISFYHINGLGGLNTKYFTEITDKQQIQEIQNNFFYTTTKQIINFPIQRAYQTDDEGWYTDKTLTINKPKLDKSTTTDENTDKFIDKVSKNIYKSGYNINCYSYQWKYKDQPIVWSWCLKYNQPIITLQLSGSVTQLRNNTDLGTLEMKENTTEIDCMHSLINGIDKFDLMNQPTTAINTIQTYNWNSCLDLSNLPHQQNSTNTITFTFERYPGRLSILHYLYLVGQGTKYQNIYRGRPVAFLYKEIARLYTYNLKDLTVDEIKNKITNTPSNSSYQIKYTDAQKEIIATEIHKFFHDTYTIQDFTWDWNKYSNGYSQELLQDVLDQLQSFYTSNGKNKIYKFTSDDNYQEIPYCEIDDFIIEQPKDEHGVAYQNLRMDLETNTDMDNYTQSGSFYMANQSNNRDGGGVLKYQLKITTNGKYTYAFFRI